MYDVVCRRHAVRWAVRTEQNIGENAPAAAALRAEIDLNPLRQCHWCAAHVARHLPAVTKPGDMCDGWCVQKIEVGTSVSECVHAMGES